MREQWQAGPIPITTINGPGVRAGWLRPPFALESAYCTDRDDHVWLIHHLPSGFLVCGIDGDVAAAVAAVDVLLTLGDWQFGAGATPPNRLRPPAQYRAAGRVLRDAGIEPFDTSTILRPPGPNDVRAH